MWGILCSVFGLASRLWTESFWVHGTPGLYWRGTFALCSCKVSVLFFVDNVIINIERILKDINYTRINDFQTFKILNTPQLTVNTPYLSPVFYVNFSI